MKLKTKILCLTTLPVIILGIIVFFVSAVNVNNAVYEQVYSGMHATDYAVRDIFEFGLSGKYQIRDGNMWKGDRLNISASSSIVDQIKEHSGMEVIVFYGDTRYLTTLVDSSGKRLTGQKAPKDVIDKVLKKGEDYQSDNIIIDGTRYIGYYIPIYQENTDSVIGMVFLGKDYNMVYRQMRKIQENIMYITIIILILTIIIATLIVRNITKALNSSMKCVHEISDGKLGLQIEHKYLNRKDDIGLMCKSIQELDNKLTDAISGIKRESIELSKSSDALNVSAGSVAAAITEVSSAVQSIADASSSQAQDATEAGEQVNVMSEMLHDTEYEISGMQSVTGDMENSANSVVTVLNELNASMEQVKHAIVNIAEQTNATHESVAHINEITRLITSIASQTSLLSLNASIEAARAGEHGKGFAVVASEIQQLSEQSNKSASEIHDVLNILTEESEKTLKTMEDVKNIVDMQEEKITATNKVFNVVGEGITNSINGIKTIAEKSNTLQDVKNNTTVIVQSVAATAEENAASTEETAATLDQVSSLVIEVSNSADNMASVAKELENLIDKFKINKE